MNLLFLLLFLLSSCLFVIFFPQDFLPTLLSAGEKSAVLCLGLLSSYAVWMGLMQVMTDCGLSEKLSRFLKPLVKRLFRTQEKELLHSLTMNVSANLLGIGGLATPYGIEAATLSEKEKNANFIQAMLFVISATSIQLIPTTALSLLSIHGAKNAIAILPPTLCSTAFSTIVGIALVFIFFRREKK